LFHAAYALGIRPSELSPSRNPYPSRGRCSPAVGRFTFCSCHRSPGPISIGHLRSRWGWSPSRGASSFSVSPTTFSRRPTRSLARPLIRDPPHPPPRSPFRAHGWEPNGPQHGTGRLTRVSCWSVERLRSEALLLLEVRSRRLQAALLDDGRCSPGLRPSRAFLQPALDLVSFASSCALPGPPYPNFWSLAGPSSSRALSRPRGVPNER
jgi:hypothetical protein